MTETPSEKSARAVVYAAAAAAVTKQRAFLRGVEVKIFKLVAAGATAEQWAEWLRAPLEHAAAAGNHDLFKRLVDAGADDGAGWAGCGGRTLLDAAVLGGNAVVVSEVVIKGSRSEVNALATPRKRSPLYAAIVLGHEAAVRELILAGADVNCKDPADGRLPLVAAVLGGYGAMVADLLHAGASSGNWIDQDHEYNVLQFAAHKGHTGVVSALLGKNVCVDVSNAEQFITPLMLASKKGHLATAQTLLAAGADAGLRSGFEETALDLAAKNGHINVLETILRHGVDVDARCPHGWSALHNAVSTKQVGAVEMLLDAGADINAETELGKTPLHYSAERGDSKSILVLLQRGATVNAVDHHGNTALHWACRSPTSRLRVTVDLLLKRGASEAAVNNLSLTPLQIFDNYLRGRRPPSFDWQRRHAAEMMAKLEPARLLLIRAPADRAWRRRCLLVILRSRSDRERIFTIPSYGGCGEATEQKHKQDGGRVLAEGHAGVAEGTAKGGTGGIGGSESTGKGCAVAGRAGVAEAVVDMSRSRLLDVVVELTPDEVFRRIVLFL